jgi:hypothetical protein
MLLHLKFCVEWFNQIQIGFENLLKNGFEKLEKKKERNFFFFSRAVFLPQPNSPACLSGPLPPPASAPAWAEPKPQPPAQPARALASRTQSPPVFPLRVADMWGPPVSVSFPFPSSSSGVFLRPNAAFSFPRSVSIFKSSSFP